MNSSTRNSTDNVEEVFGRALTFLKRSYLHVRIIECWLNEGEEGSSEGRSSSISYYNIIACLYHGGEKLAQGSELSTGFVLGCTNLRWNELLTFPIVLYDLPKEVRLNLALYRGSLHNTDQVVSKIVGWTNFCFVDENGVFITRKQNIKLWKDPPFYSCGTFGENTTEDFSAVLSVELDYSAYPLSFQCREVLEDEGDSSDGENDPPTPTDDEMDLLDSITLTSDIITPPTEAQKHVLWQLRHALVENPRALPKFLMSVPWSRHSCVRETHRILGKWKPLPPFYALQLLGPQFGDKVVRDYAVDRLQALTDEEFQLILIQLAQALVYEPYNNSKLLELILERSNNWTIGQQFFWLVKTGIQVPFFKARFEFVIEKLLAACKPEYTEELIKQDDFVGTLLKIAYTIKETKSEARQQVLEKMLSKIPFPEPITVPLNPRFE